MERLFQLKTTLKDLDPFFLMLNPEDFYNLTSYASRFTQGPDRLVALYFSEVTVINRIELLEEAKIILPPPASISLANW